MSRGEMLQVQMNIIETKQIYKPWLPLLKANLPRSTRTKGGKRDSSPRWQMSLMTWKNCDIVVVLIYGVDTKVNEKLTLLTKVYKAVCQSMGEENINKLVRRYNHTLLCHCHTMTADKISLLFCHLRWTKNCDTYAGVVEGRHERDDQVHIWAEVLQGCSWDQGQYFYIPFSYINHCIS